jgi:hypothetical protein
MLEGLDRKSGDVWRAATQDSLDLEYLGSVALYVC